MSQLNPFSKDFDIEYFGTFLKLDEAELVRRYPRLTAPPEPEPKPTKRKKKDEPIWPDSKPVTDPTPEPLPVPQPTLF